MSFPPVSELLPHDPPMILVDELIDYADGVAVCALEIRPGPPWVQEGRVPAYFAIEYMAQTIACNAGMRARERGKDVRVGFLLGSRELTLRVDYLYVGDQLRVSARHVFGDEKLGSFECEVQRGDETLARATLNVFAGDLSEAGI